MKGEVDETFQTGSGRLGDARGCRRGRDCSLLSGREKCSSRRAIRGWRGMRRCAGRLHLGIEDKRQGLNPVLSVPLPAAARNHSAQSRQASRESNLVPRPSSRLRWNLTIAGLGRQALPRTYSGSAASSSHPAPLGRPCHHSTFPASPWSSPSAWPSAPSISSPGLTTAARFAPSSPAI